MSPWRGRSKFSGQKLTLRDSITKSLPRNKAIYFCATKFLAMLYEEREEEGASRFLDRHIWFYLKPDFQIFLI